MSSCKAGPGLAALVPELDLLLNVLREYMIGRGFICRCGVAGQLIIWDGTRPAHVERVTVRLEGTNYVCSVYGRVSTVDCGTLRILPVADPDVLQKVEQFVRSMPDY